MMFPKEKRMSRSKLVAQLDAVFSRLVRLSEADEYGYCHCVTCGSRRHWTEVDAGHFIPRKHLASRWDLRNVRPQCVPCNRFGGGKPEEFAIQIDARYGIGTSGALRRNAATTGHWPNERLESLLREIKSKVRELEAKHGTI